MSLIWEHTAKILDQITKTNRWWHTQKEDRLADTYVIGASGKKRAIDEIVAQDVA